MIRAFDRLSVVLAVASKHKTDAPQVVFHKDLFASIVIFFVVCALWGLFLTIRGQPPSGSYLGALVIGVGLIAIQALSGLVLIVTGYAPHEPLHWLYGFVLLFTIPVAYGAWAQRNNDRWASFFYALGCILIVVIAVVRSKATG